MGGKCVPGSAVYQANVSLKINTNHKEQKHILIVKDNVGIYSLTFKQQVNVKMCAAYI